VASKFNPTDLFKEHRMSSLATPNDEDSAIQLTKAATARGHVGPACEKCDAPINVNEALVCRKCGWYASIGSFVELDQNWECDSEVEAPAEEPLKMPTWGWTMIACVVAVVAESIVARVITMEGSALRTTWSVTQLFVGMSLAFVCHFTAFVLLMREVSDAQLLDIILKPIKPWIVRVRELPRYQWLCHVGISSVVAVFMSLVVIGGLPYEKLWDWGFKKPVKKDLMGAIMSEVQGEGEEKPLEEAVQDFAGKQNLDDKTKKPTKPTEPKERQEDDCVIIGYRANSEGLVYILFLAGENFGKLQYVGQVTPQLSVKELRGLTEQLAAHQAHEPFVKIQMEGVTWVDPKFTCRVSYARKGKKGGLFDIKLEALMGEIEAIAPQPEKLQEEK